MVAFLHVPSALVWGLQYRPHTIPPIRQRSKRLSSTYLRVYPPQRPSCSPPYSRVGADLFPRPHPHHFNLSPRHIILRCAPHARCPDAVLAVAGRLPSSPKRSCLYHLVRPPYTLSKHHDTTNSLFPEPAPMSCPLVTVPGAPCKSARAIP